MIISKIIGDWIRCVDKATLIQRITAVTKIVDLSEETITELIADRSAATKVITIFTIRFSRKRTQNQRLEAKSPTFCTVRLRGWCHRSSGLCE